MSSRATLPTLVWAGPLLSSCHSNGKGEGARTIQAMLARHDSKRDILTVLDLEDTPENLAPFAIERSRGVILTSCCFCAWRSTLLLSGSARPSADRADPELANPLHIRSSPCPPGTETNPDSTGSENKRSLDGSVRTNCSSAQQRHGSQQTPQSVRSRGRCRHEQPAVGLTAVRVPSRRSQEKARVADRRFVCEARFADCGAPSETNGDSDRPDDLLKQEFR